MDEFRSYIYIVATAFSLSAMVYTWLTARSKANTSEIETIKQNMATAAAVAELREKVARQDDRLARSETRIDHLVDVIPELRKDFGQVHRRLDDLAGTVHRIDGSTSALTQTHKLLVQHLLKDDA